MRRTYLLSAALLSACASDGGLKKVNSVPTVLITSHTDGDTVVEGTAETFRGQVGDSNHALEDLSVTWLQDGAETCDESAPDDEGVVSCEMVFGTDGGEVILEVRDPEGAGDTAQVTLTVEPEEAPNSPPSCAITGPEDGTVGAYGETVEFTGTATDLNVTPDFLTVDWSSDQDGPIGASTPTAEGEVSFPFADLSVSTHVITMTVTDELGADCTATLNYTVGAAPTISITAPTDGVTLTTEEAVVFEAIVEDMEDAPEALTLSWESGIDGVFSTESADSSGTAAVSIDSLTAGEQVVTLTATDTDGMTASATVSFTLNEPEPAFCPGGSADIHTPEDLIPYLPCTELDGLSLHMTSGIETVSLPLLEAVNGSVYFHQNNDVTTVELPALRTVSGHVYFHQNYDIETVSMPSLETVDEYFYFHQNYALEYVDASSLESVGRYLYFSGNELLSTLLLTDSLTSVGEYVSIGGSPLLCEPDLDWPSISDSVSISGLASCDGE